MPTYRVTEPVNFAPESQSGGLKVKAGEIIKDTDPRFPILNARMGMLVEVTDEPPYLSKADVLRLAKEAEAKDDEMKTKDAKKPEKETK